MKIFALFSLFLIAAATLSAQQAAPKLMHYQGKLTNPMGGALADGQYTLRFELFDAATAGQRVWGESRTNVPLVGGLFSVVLGAAGSTTVTPSAVNDLGFAFGGADRYLQTTVVSGPGVTTPQTLLPRQQLASVPFAMQSQQSQSSKFADQAQNSSNAEKLAGKEPAFYMPPGVVVAYSGTTPPAGWLVCDGRTLNKNTNVDYEALYAAIETNYGAGDGTSGSFNLPDYRGVFLRGGAFIPSVTITAVDTALETVTVTGHPYRRNGVPVRLTGSVPTGLVADTTYYSIVVDANKLAFATTEANATAATPVRINITASGTGVVEQAIDPDFNSRRAPVNNVAFPGIGSFQGDMFKSHTHIYRRSRNKLVDSGTAAPAGEIQSVYDNWSTDATGGNETRPINVYVNYIIKY